MQSANSRKQLQRKRAVSGFKHLSFYFLMLYYDLGIINCKVFTFAKCALL